MSNALDEGGPAAVAARGHAARCARCQAHARALAALHGRLERGAVAPGVPAPAPLAAARPRRGWLAAGGAAVAAAGVVLALRAGGPAPRTDPPVAIAPAPGLPSSPEPALPALQRTASRVSHKLAKVSLETELRALLDDGARGVGAVLASSGLRERL
jgi:hypothetical protein